MGQSASVPALLPELSPPTMKTSQDSAADYTSDLPDECLALIFQSLSAENRNRCSLVCKLWLIVDARSRRDLSLDAKPELGSHIPAIFSRFDSVTNLTLSCDRESASINDGDVLSVSLSCPNLTHLELSGCRNVSDLGVASLARNCKNLTKLTCFSCSFGIKGFNAVLEHCCLFEELFIIKCFPSEPHELMGSSKSLKSIYLKDVDNGELFAPLIIGSINLRALKLIACGGDWDVVLESMVNSNDRIEKIFLCHLPQVSDAVLSSIYNCASLEILEVFDVPNCTDLGIVSVAERCKHLREVAICCFTPNYKIGDEGLVALGRNCINLKELILVGTDLTIDSLEVIASVCRNLEKLGLAETATMRDSELCYLARKCKALKRLMIWSCPVSDVGLTALFWGFPSLEEVLIIECVEVGRDILHWLKMERESLTIQLESAEIKLGEVGTSDGARAQGSMWHVMLFWYFLRSTPYKAINLH